MVQVISNSGAIASQFSWKANQLASGVDRPYGIALDQSTGDIYVTGQVRNSVDGYVYVTRLLNSGTVVWTKTYGTSGLDNIGWHI